MAVETEGRPDKQTIGSPPTGNKWEQPLSRELVHRYENRYRAHIHRRIGLQFRLSARSEVPYVFRTVNSNDTT